MEPYNYSDYNSMIQDIVNGRFVVNQPIVVEGNNVSFLENLLNYSNIDSHNIHEILETILHMIKAKLYKEQLKPNVSALVNHVQGEWGNDKENCLFCDHDCSKFNGIQPRIQEMNDYENLVKKLEEKFMTQKTYSQMLPETEMGEYSVLELSNSLDDLQRKCSQVNEIIQKEIELLENEKQKISNIDLSLLLDISSKHINIYKALNNDSTNIDENIHNIFMNYTFVLNLLKKQINHLIKIMLEIKENVNSKCDLLNTFIEDIETSKIQKVGCSNKDLTFF